MDGIKLRCCVIDDEPLAAQLIADYARRTPSLELEGVFTSSTEAYPLISSGSIDLLFLDIQMPQLSGMELVKLLPEHTSVIFVTAYENYAIDGYKVNASDYLLKPVDYEEFLEAVGRVVRRHTSEWTIADHEGAVPQVRAEDVKSWASNDYIIVRSEYRYLQIRKTDIVYVEGLKDYVRIYVEGSHRSVVTLLSMKTIEQALSPSEFLRVHRSYIVNLNKIRSIEKGHIYMVNNQEHDPGREIPIGDSYRANLQAFISARSLE